jgi:uncharacterized protein YndB with AHSA1/START domain
MVQIEVTYPYEPSHVWEALSSSEALAEWLMPNTFRPVLGHEFEFRTRPAPGFDGIVHCRVLELDPPRRLAFSWAGGGIDTVVRFELTPTEQGTRVRFSQTGFTGVKGLLLGAMLGNGWRGMLHRKLPRLLSRSNARAGLPAVCEGETAFWRMFNRLVGRS